MEWDFMGLRCWYLTNLHIFNRLDLKVKYESRVEKTDLRTNNSKKAKNDWGGGLVLLGNVCLTGSLLRSMCTYSLITLLKITYMIDSLFGWNVRFQQ